MTEKNNTQESFEKSVNEKIKLYRVGKNYSIFGLAKETRVSIEVIKGIENKKYNLLPSLAYSSGLLTNILEFLKVDLIEANKIIEEFENDFMKFEQDSTQVELNKIKNYTKTSEKNKIIENTLNYNLIWFSTFLIITIFLIFLFFKYGDRLFSSNQSNLDRVDNFSMSTNDSRVNEVFSLYNSSATFTVGKGDEIKVFFQNKIIVFKIDIVDTKDVAKIKLNYLEDKTIILSLFQDTKISLDNSEVQDILIKFQQISGELAIVYFSLINENKKYIDYSEIWTKQEKILLTKNEFSLLKNENKSVIQCFIKATTLPIHLSYNIDGQRQNTINLKPGNEFSIMAQNHLEIQIGNYRSAQLVINRIPIKIKLDDENQFGVTKIIKWAPSPNNETRFDLIIKDFIN